jgi:hypothetical protein
MKNKEVLYNFLVEEGLLFQFIDTISKFGFKSIDDYCKRQSIWSYIRNIAIKFEKEFEVDFNKTVMTRTPQYLMWVQLDTKWEKYLDNYFLKKRGPV